MSMLSHVCQKAFENRRKVDFDIFILGNIKETGMDLTNRKIYFKSSCINLINNSSKNKMLYINNYKVLFYTNVKY